ncbi:MAG: hypothetical protein EGMGGAKC_00322 [Dehalococcoides mccartyi]|nr:hypothetical protein [Dehalococcoides mccartyi]
MRMLLTQIMETFNPQRQVAMAIIIMVVDVSTIVAKSFQLAF